MHEFLLPQTALPPARPPLAEEHRGAAELRGQRRVPAAVHPQQETADVVGPTTLGGASKRVFSLHRPVRASLWEGLPLHARNCSHAVMLTGWPPHPPAALAQPSLALLVPSALP